MKVFAQVLGSLMLWGITIFITSEVIGGVRRQLSRRHFRIYLLLWFGGPVLAILTAALFDDLLGPSTLALALCVAIPLGVCWTLAIFLLFKFKRSGEGAAAER
jgi:hypothetical protein